MIHCLLLAYNEEGGIGPSLERLNELLRGAGEPFRLYVVDDGSKDRTAEVVREAAKALPVTLLQHRTNLGVARGFDTGLRHIAKAARPDDAIVTLEGDNTNDPEFLHDMLRLIRSGSDVVCASRYIRGGRYVGFPLKRRIFSFGANWLMRLAFPVDGVRDFTIFFRAYRARAIQAAILHYGDKFIERAGFTANAEILYKVNAASEIRASEVPLVYRYDRKKGGSKMKVGNNLKEYGRLFSEMTKSEAGIPLRQSLTFFLATLVLGAFGIGWGLPEWERIEAATEPALVHDARFHKALADSRDDLYRQMEGNERLPVDLIKAAEELPPGWTWPPQRLMNSLRSYYLRSSNADEQKNLTYLAHMKPRELNFEPYAASYGGAFLYPLGAWYGAAAVLRLIRITSDLTAYLADPSLMAGVFKAGRWFNTFAIALAAAALAAFGRWLAGAAGGWVAGTIFVALPVVTIVTHTVNPYGWATFWAMMMFLYVTRYLDRGEETDLLKAGAAFGMCFGSSIAFWSVSLAMPLASMLRAWQTKDWKAEVLGLSKAAALGWLVFFLTNPYLFFKFRVYEGELRYEMYAFPWEFSARVLEAFWREFLSFNMGLAASGLALLLAFVYGLGPKSKPALRVSGLLFLLGCLQLAVRTTDPQHGRHFLPFIALGSAIAAAGIARIWKGERAWLAAALLAGILAENVPASASYLWTMSREAAGRSTRMDAGRWINANLPEEASVGLVVPPQPADTPPFRFDRYRIVLFAEPGQLQGRELPRYVVVSDPRRFHVLDVFLRERYHSLMRFDPPRLFPWVPVLGLYAITGAPIEVFELGK